MNVKEELNKGVNYFLSHEDEMVLLYKHVTGRTISISCGKCIVNAYNELARRTDERKYKMKRGKVIQNPFGSDPQFFNRSNVTDEISEKLINLGYGKHFE